MKKDILSRIEVEFEMTVELVNVEHKIEKHILDLKVLTIMKLTLTQ